MTPLTLRRLNRALLARQLLLARRRLPVPRAIERLCALQAQYPPSPYIALWARLDGFRKEQLTRALERGAVVKGTVVRTTLHLLSREDFPFAASAYVASQRARAERLGADIEALHAALAGPPRPTHEVREIVAQSIGTDDEWSVSFVLRSVPWIRLPPSGSWGFHGSGESVLWPGPLPPAHEATAHLVRSTLAAFGPMTRKDVEHFTYLPVRQLEPALDRMRRLEQSEGPVFYDVPRGPLPPEAVAAPPRFLPSFDSAILAHHDRTRILPRDYHEAVIRRVNATTRQTFLVDGFVAGAWKVERAKTKATLLLEPFGPIPRAARRELVEEAERLVRFVAGDATSYAVRS